MRYKAAIENSHIRLTGENRGFMVAFRGGWYAVGLWHDELYGGMITLSPCPNDTERASIECQTLVDKIKDQFREA